MAIRAFDEMNIVPARRIQKRSVHLLHVQTAVGQPRMARGARGARLLPVLQMARQTTQPLVNAHRRAVVTRTGQPSGQRRVALIAQRLSCIRTDLQRARPVPHGGQRQ